MVGYATRGEWHHSENDVAKKERLRFAGQLPERHEITETPAAMFNWDQWHNRFLFVADAKILVDVICGRAALKSEEDTPLLDRIVNGFCDLFNLGWSAPSVLDDPVVWMPRHENKVADGLADLTMDRGTSWKREFLPRFGLEQSNIVIQTDGGRRSEKCAAASVVVGLLTKTDGQLCYEPWFAQGLYFDINLSVFQTEAIAMETAVSLVVDEVNKFKHRARV